MAFRKGARGETQLALLLDKGRPGEGLTLADRVPSPKITEFAPCQKTDIRHQDNKEKAVKVRQDHSV